jgi:uncharacterized NAD-dependent epimerase/dehydratase family protein
MAKRSSPARDATLALLAGRAPEATVCPSEVARMLVASAGTDWRNAMPEVHAAIDRLLAEQLIGLSWKGKALATRAGPYRIARSARG